jgi:hypothetical protein
VLLNAGADAGVGAAAGANPTVFISLAVATFASDASDSFAHLAGVLDAVFAAGSPSLQPCTNKAADTQTTIAIHERCMFCSSSFRRLCNSVTNVSLKKFRQSRLAAKFLARTEARTANRDAPRTAQLTLLACDPCLKSGVGKNPKQATSNHRPALGKLLKIQQTLSRTGVGIPVNPFNRGR